MESQPITQKSQDWRYTQTVSRQQELERESYNKIDGRNVVEHTFSGTGANTVRHQLGRIPAGCVPVKQSAAANIIYVSGTKTTISVQSSVGGITASLLLF